MTTPVLLSTRQGKVARLSLNRPSTRNSLDQELVDLLANAVESVGADPGVRVLVLSGEGGAFCSGVDLRSAASELQDPQQLARRLDGFHRLIRAIIGANQPVLAALDGPAVGFGAELALACDLRVASTQATFDEKFVTIGLMPDGGGSFHLARTVGLGRALEHLLLATPIDAQTALSWGLVSKVVERSELLSEVGAIAERLAAAPPLALTAIKRAVRAGLSSNLEQSLARERQGQLELLSTDDAREAVSAFLARRAPRFEGG